MSLRIAILDLGTNTFHLLVAEVNNKQKATIIYREERWVFLAEKGIETVADSAIARATETLSYYNSIIHKYECNIVTAFGTAAFRKAGNKEVLKQTVLNTIGCEVSIIEGEREAELIYKGVNWACSLKEQRSLIMDIGGGSTEFIIADGNKIYWKKSFPLGASILKQKFHHHEPILAKEGEAMLTYLNNELEELKQQANEYKPTLLIGASGSFDSFASMLLLDKISSTDTFHILDKEQLLKQFHYLYALSHEQRMEVKGLIPFRAEMIVAASILTEFILTNFSFERILQSSYALKEGVLQEMAGS